uniref:Ig-like domain-containing protein n=1 Tax=Timema bartmani TaxID=61472 RepID=A0A7R9HYU2_9NEOP|nr:unnamed protein product [Timema bartmani]
MVVGRDHCRFWESRGISNEEVNPFLIGMCALVAKRSQPPFGVADPKFIAWKYSSFVDGILDGQGPLLMLEPPPRLEFSNNSGGRLDCSARGSPTPNLHWMMADGSPASTVTGLRYQLSNGTLVFPPFSAADFRPDVHHAIYRCVASNSLGRVISRDVRLRAVFEIVSLCLQYLG